MADNTSDAFKALVDLFSDFPNAKRLAQLRLFLDTNPGVLLEQDAEGRTLLHLAARYHHVLRLEYWRVIFKFDRARESLQMRDNRGWLPFHCACEGKNLGKAKYLLEMYPDCINVTDNEGRNCLHILIEHNCSGFESESVIEFAEFLLEHSPGLISSTATDGDLPMHLVCYVGRSWSIILFLHDVYPEAIYATNNDGDTPLTAVQRTHAYAHEDGEENDYDYQNGPLSAIRNAIISFFQYQLARVDEARNDATPDERGQLPIHRALMNVNLSVGTVKLMLDGNPHSSLIADGIGQTPLCIACRHCNVVVIKYLVEVCEDSLRINDASGELPLHIACRNGMCNVVKWILEKSDAGLSVQNNEGKIPIQLFLYNTNPFCDRNSLEYVQAVYMLLRANPTDVEHLCG
jgi:ankyrin repeat protein